VCTRVTCFSAQVLARLDGEARAYLRAEHDTFQAITDISGALKPVPKAERKDAIAVEARKISLPRADLYLPVDTHKRLVALLPDSGAPMQSAAKVPILLAFQARLSLLWQPLWCAA